MKEIKTNMPLKEQVEILASYIAENHSDHITAENGGAIQTAIAIMKMQQDSIHGWAEHSKEYSSLHP